MSNFLEYIYCTSKDTEKLDIISKKQRPSGRGYKNQASQEFLVCNYRTAELKKQLDDALEQIDEMKAARQRQADMVSESIPTHQMKLINFSREANVGASFAKQ